MKRFAMFFAFLVFVGLPILQAQTLQITGVVTSSEDGNAVPGVSVVVKGTTMGTTTDFDGKYSLNVPSGSTVLVYSFVGLKTQEVEIGGRNLINVVMESDVIGLDEVVVTALGISREKKSLGYAQQEVKGDDLNKVQNTNFLNALSGKVSGVQINTTNNFGGSTSVVIRGFKSITSGNQALFVVDGVPLDNSTTNTSRQQGGSTGYDYGNPAADINPDNIESLSVLKGAAATALYGSRAANGVVLITTKSGKKQNGIGISFTTGATFGKIDKSTFIKYQNQYGAGYYTAWYGGDVMQGFEEHDIDGDGTLDLVVPTYEDASFGLGFDPSISVYTWESFVPESENYMKKQPWVAAKHSPVDFFETAYTYNTGVSLNGSTEKSTYRLGYNYTNSSGILPNSHLDKHNISFKSNYDFTKKLSSEIGLNYSLETAKGRNSTGYSDNLMSSFRQWWQVNNDIKDLQMLYNKTGRNVTWNMNAPWNGDTEPIYWDNPYWTRYKNYETDSRGRLVGFVSLNYEILPWLKAVGKVSMDTYSTLQEERRSVGSTSAPFGLSTGDESSGYMRYNKSFTEMNYDGYLNFKKNLGTDFNLTGIAGINIRHSKLNTIRTATNGGLIVPDLYAISNSASTPWTPVEGAQEVQVNGYYVNGSVGYKNFLYFEGSERYDQSSTLPKGKNGYSYWSASGSLLFSELAKISWLNLGKFRLNYAEVGNSAPALSIDDTYDVIDKFGSSILFSVPSRKNNSELKPEKTKSYEAGIELNVFESRIGLDMAVYKSNTFNQLIPSDVDPATGYSSKWVNAGNVENKGVEIALTLKPIVTTDFSWDIRFNWSRNRNKVIELYKNPATGEELQNITLNSYQGGVSANATLGKPFGVIRGSGFQYVDGKKVVLSSGYYAAVSDQIIADPNPDWTGGIFNSFTYKKLTFSFLIDIKKGGQLFSLDTYYGMGTGLTDNTVGTNDLGNPIRNTIADGGGIILDGVYADGTANTTRVRADYYGGVFYWGNATRNPAQTHVYDAGFVKLREVSLSYDLPSQILGKAKFIKRASFAITGHNLWIIHKNVPYADPESGLGVGNVQGYLSGSYPTVRELGFNVKLDF